MSDENLYGAEVIREAKGQYQLEFPNKNLKWKFIKYHFPEIAEQVIEFKKKGIGFHPPIVLIEKHRYHQLLESQGASTN